MFVWEREKVVYALVETGAMYIVQACVSGIKKWMCLNFLMLNADKPELLIVRPPKCNSLPEHLSLTFDNCTITENKVVKNLGVLYDANLTSNLTMMQT